MPKVEIIPAILPKSLADLTAHLERIRGTSRKVQIDVVGGGMFSWKRSWPFRDHRSLVAMLKERKGLPYWTEFDTEVDLMVKNSKDLALTFVGLHVARVIVHARDFGALEAAQMLSEYEDNEHSTPVGVGVALAADASPQELEPFVEFYDFVQVMGIEKEGYQGRPFDERALALISSLRRKHPEFTIQVDGGVSLKNVKALVEAGANRLIAGSAIFSSQNPAEALKALYTEANG